MDEDAWSALGVDVTRPSAARVYDYILGGDCNFEVDRQLARQVVEAMPSAPRVARANRDFLRRAIAMLAADEGVGQFLDIGSGIPTARGSVHENAREHDPQARVAYVEIDPVAVGHGAVLLADDERAVIVQGDVRTPDAVLSDPAVRRTIDFSRPVAVLLLAVLHFVEDDREARAIVDRIARQVAPGSFFVVSHYAGLTLEGRDMEDVAHRVAVPLTPRSVTQISEIMHGLELVDPGVVPPRRWRPQSPVSAEVAAEDELIAGVWHRFATYRPDPAA